MSYIKNTQQVFEKAHACSVTPQDKSGSYQVFSPSGAIYNVDISDPQRMTCDCPWGLHHSHSGCAHVVAAVMYSEKQKNRQVYAFNTVSAARMQHAPMFKLNGINLVSRRARVLA